MNAMRRGIAEHMRRSLDTSAHVTSAIEVDMSRVVAARERLKKEYEAKHGTTPTGYRRAFGPGSSNSGIEEASPGGRGPSATS